MTTAQKFDALVGEAVLRHADAQLSATEIRDGLNDQEYYQTARRQHMTGATERVVSQLLDRAVSDIIESGG